MSQPFLGEIYWFAFSFPPRGFATCDGQLLPINQNQALFALLGTMYGGDGRTTFALPDLRGRTPFDDGTNAKFTLGRSGGEATHVLTNLEIAAHSHVLRAVSTNGTTTSPTAALPARDGTAALYAPPSAPAAAMGSAVGPTGGSQPHENMPPYLVLNACIALQGIFPSQN